MQELLVKSFHNIGDGPEIIIKDNSIAILVHHDKDKGPLMVLQMEFEEKLDNASTLKPSQSTVTATSRMNRQPSDKGKPYKKIELQVLHVILQAVQLKIERILFR